MSADSMIRVDGPTGSSTPYRVKLCFSDGETRTVDVNVDQAILSAARDQGVALASQCTVGTCSTCVANLITGTAEMRKDVVTVLTSAEAAGGQRLLCQTLALTDAEFDMGYPSSLLLANPPIFFNAKVNRINRLSESVAEMVMKVPKTMKFRFSAGQYCRIKVPGANEWRSYSMASGEHEENKLSFLVRLLPHGAMSDYLRDKAKVGDSLELEGPLGAFVLEPSERPHVLIAGGTGLAPLLSMIDRLRLVRPSPPILLVFGCAQESDLFHLGELQARTSFIPSLDVRICLEKESSNAEVVVGNPVSVLRQSDFPPGAIAYLCGPPGMITAAESALLGFGLTMDSIRSEQFLPS